jgi:hypothetical protein
VRELPQLQNNRYAYSDGYLKASNQSQRYVYSLNLIKESGSVITDASNNILGYDPGHQSAVLKTILENAVRTSIAEPNLTELQPDVAPLYCTYRKTKAKLEADGHVQEYIHWRNLGEDASSSLVAYLVEDCGLPKTKQKAALAQCRTLFGQSTSISIILYLRDNAFTGGQPATGNNRLFPEKKTTGFIAFANHQIIAFKTKEKNHSLRNVLWLEAILANDDSQAVVHDKDNKPGATSRAQAFYTKFGFSQDANSGVFRIDLKNSEHARKICENTFELSARGDARFVPGLQRKGPPAREFTKDGKQYPKFYCGKYVSDAWRVAENEDGSEPQPYFAIVDDPKDTASYPDKPWRENGDKNQCFQQGMSFGAHLGKRTFG